MTKQALRFSVNHMSKDVLSAIESGGENQTAIGKCVNSMSHSKYPRERSRGEVGGMRFQRLCSSARPLNQGVLF